MDYYLQQKIDNVRYYADQQILEINRRATEEIRTLVEQHSAQMQQEIDRRLHDLTF